MPAGTEFMVMVKGSMTVRENDCVAVAAFASVTLAVKLALPAVVGVPAITHVALLRLKPAGRVPEEIEQE
jgi:hypothetical protein